MADKRFQSKYSENPTSLKCRYCGAANPLKAYCCITCFKILRPKQKTNLVQLVVRPSVLIIIFLVGAIWGAMVIMKKWIDSIDARVQMDLKTSDYNISVVADKRSKPDDAAVPLSSESLDAVSPDVPAALPSEVPPEN